MDNQKIYVNARFLTQKITGVQRFAVEICNRLPKEIDNKKIIFLAPRAKRETDLDNRYINEIGIFSGNIWEQYDLPLFLKKNGNPLLINFVGIGPVLYKNKITTLYDLAFKHHPQWFSYSFQLVYNLLIPLSIKNAIHLITDSHYVKNDIVNTYNYNPQNCTVIYAAASKKFHFKNLPREKIILTVSSIDPRKNLKSVIEAYSQISTDYTLVIVGKKSRSFAEISLEEVDIDSKIEFTGYLSDNDLIDLYNRAEIFIYASFFEGFGIPPLEAQSCGSSCIVSNVTSLPEVYQESVLYCNPSDLESIKKALLKLIQNDDLRKRLSKEGFENAKRFDWDKSAIQMVNVIKSVKSKTKMEV